MDALLMGAVGALELYIQMDPHADGFLEEPECGVSMDDLLLRMWMHTDTWSLWMPCQWTIFCIPYYHPSINPNNTTTYLLMN